MAANAPSPATADSSRLFGRSEFAPEEKEHIRRLLEQKLGKDHLTERPGAGGTKYTYIESHKVIQLANQIFGFNGWSSSVVDVTPDFVEETPGKYTVGVTAVVKVLLKDGSYHEDVGYGVGENPRKGDAIEKAKKEAVTDARKRALRLFGNALGNSIYDKQHVKKYKSERTDVHGFVVEPSKPPLAPQNMAPAATVALNTAANAPAGNPIDPTRRATTNYSPPQPPVRQMPTLPPRLTPPAPPGALPLPQYQAPQAPPLQSQTIAADAEYVDYNLPDA